MARITLLGASGYTGRLVAQALDRRGAAFLAAGRDRTRVERAVADLGACEGIRTVDVTDPPAVSAMIAETDVLATTVGPFDQLGRGVLEAAADAGIHYLDSTGEQPFLRWAFEEVASRYAAGGAAVPASGFDFVPGDLCADVAASEVAEAREVHVAYLVRGRGSVASRGTRRTASRILAEDAFALEGGTLTREPFAQARRHAWFPRPVGPKHAVGFPGGEPFMVPGHVPTAATVRTYLALPGTLADLAMTAANVLRWAPARDLAERVLTLGPEGPSASSRSATRWACVAEVHGAEGEVSRAWAYGRDMYGFTGEAMAAIAVRLRDGRADASGVVAPATAFDAADLLDDLAVATGLRWSVTPPE